MIMPGRKYTTPNSNYHYGFNGKENDNEVKGEDNQQDYGFRIHDPRSGRFLSVDPLRAKYPELTPYQFASNTPIRAIDLDGLEMIDVNMEQRRGNRAALGENITPAQQSHLMGIYNDAQNKMGAVGTVIAVDVYLTRGWLSRIVFGAQVLDIFEHNRASTPEGQKKQDERAKQKMADAFMSWGVSKFIGISARVVTTAGKVVYKTFSSSSVRFSQSSVNGLDEIATSMKANGWKGDPIDIVKMKDNIYTTVDNTRLLAAQKAGINVKAVAHNYDDLIPEEMANRFLNKQGVAPKTWGEAVENRIQNQNKQFRTNNANGSFVEPKANTNTQTGTGGG